VVGEQFYRGWGTVLSWLGNSSKVYNKHLERVRGVFFFVYSSYMFLIKTTTSSVRKFPF